MDSTEHDADNSAGHGWDTHEVRLACPWVREDAEAGHAPAVDCAASSTGTPWGTPGGTPLGGSPDQEVAQQVSVTPTIVRAAVAKHAEEASSTVKDWNNLPSDFRLHLQLFEKVSKQAHMLQQLSKQQENAFNELRGMQQQMLALNTASQVADMREELKKLQETQAKLTEAVQTSSHKSDAHHEHLTELFKAMSSTGGEEESDEEEAENVIQDNAPPYLLRGRAGGGSMAVGVGPPRAKSDEDEVEGPEALDQDAGLSRRTKQYFKDGRGNKLMEAVCATVIMANAISMGVKAEMNAKAFIQGQESSVEMWTLMNVLERFYLCFYTLEFIFKSWIFGKDMLKGPDWKWNWFDLVLLLLAYFEDFADIAKLEQAGVDVTWMRLLRLLKMLKMLRVVRVMRFFKELRTMLSSLIGSVATLMWSLLMIFLITYIFGLIFLQAVAAYIEANGAENLDETTYGNIKAYWNGVAQAVITLYMAVTGGSDWEPLAQPFKVMPDSGQLYYMIFLLYIAFSMIAVLNVLTGMFVDAAMKVAENDQGDVFDEIMERSKVQLEAFTQFLEDNCNDGSGTVHWPLLQQNVQTKQVKDFLKAFEMEPADLHNIYKNLNHAGGVPIVEFIEACAKCRGDTSDIEMLGMKADFKRYSQQLGHMMEYTEERFNEVHGLFRNMGAPTSKVQPLSQRLARSGTLPATWSKDLSRNGSPAGASMPDRQGETGPDDFSDLSKSARVKVHNAGLRHGGGP